MLTEEERSTSDKQRIKVRDAADNRCMAMVEVPHLKVWTRCFTLGVEVHHLLTRARGGDLLDEAGEIDHLIALCPTHHRYAHGPGGRAAGFLIDGFVLKDYDGSIYYHGPDEGLSKKYPRKKVGER